MIKYLIFDLDGVLADCKDLHYHSLNKALEKFNYKPISYTEHITEFDGLSTSQKLQKLLHIDRINKSAIADVSNAKQQITEQQIDEFIKPNKSLCDTFRLLKEHYEILVCSNAKMSTCLRILKRLGLHSMDNPHSLVKTFDIISNDDMVQKKPSAFGYLSVIAHPDKGADNWTMEPNECLAIEDSYHGTSSAKKAGMHVLNVRNSNEISYSLIQDEVRTLNKRSSCYAPNFKNINVLIPMSGRGQRFVDDGYNLPKPLIEVNGKPMITRVVENLNLPHANYIFIVQKEHEDTYNVSGLLKSITDSPHIVLVDQVTEGAACSALLAKEQINNENNLIIANSDQLVEWSSFDFLYRSFYRDLDVNIAVFLETFGNPKWSFSEINDGTNLVSRVAEKQPISSFANAGIFYWKKGSDFVESSERMIKSNQRVNNEFYIAPSINLMIADRKKVGTYRVDKMFGIGTPEDLETYLNG